MESTASILESLCHVVDQCFENIVREKRERRALCEIELTHNLFLGTIRVVTTIPVVNNIRVIITLKTLLYSAHSSPPFTHSKTSPATKIAMNIREIGIKLDGLVISLAAGKGNSKAISKSKSRNNIATRKNRKEKGSRADFRGSKPHS